MRVPVRRLPQTRISEQQQGYARAAPALNVTPITEAIDGFRQQLQDEQRDREKFEANKRLLDEVNELQSDFESRRRNPEISPIDFADTTNAAYRQRHQALLDELHNEGFDSDVIEELDIKLSTVRQGFYERGLGHQLATLKDRAINEADDLGVSASQYVAANPDGYASARDMIRESVASMPDLLEADREAKTDELLGILRDSGAKALAIQNPQLIVDLFDPQGLTAPYRPPAATGGGAVNVEGLDADRGAVASVLSSGGLSAPVVAGFLGNFDVEGGYGGGLGDGGTASGIAQWREERRANFRRKFGKEPHQATKEEQAQFVLWELDNPADAGMTAQQVAAIKGADTAEEAAELIDKFYERSSGEHRSRRTKAAAAYVGLGTSNEPVQRVELPPSVSAAQPVIAGNLPLDVTQRATNADGTVSTVRTISIGTDKGEVLIPTVIDGKVVSDEEAIRHYKETGENFGTFETKEQATAFAQALHEKHEAALPPQNIAEAKTGNALLDDLNGPERLQALSWAREQLNRVSASRKAEMDVTIDNYIAEVLNNGGESGTRMPTDEEIRSAYPDPTEAAQKIAQMQQAKDTGKAMQTFRTQSAADIQRGLDAIEPQPGSPTYAAELQIYQSAERAAQAILQERQSDPAAYAMKYFPSIGAALKKGTSEYYAELDRVYETLGIDSNRAPLLSAEATRQIVGDYKLMSPPQKLQFMRENFAGMGEDRFRRFVSNMEGTTAQDDARIYALLRTYPRPNGEWAMVYQQVLEGREVMAKDPARRPSAELINQQFRTEGLSAITSLNADASSAIQEAAAALYVMKGGDPKVINRNLYRESLRTALGGSLPVNMRKGAVKDYTILPPRVTEPQFQNWIERQTAQSLTDASVEGRRPRYGDLKTPAPLHDILDDGVFVMVSPGRYMIKMASDGKPLMTESGRPFLVNVRTEDVNAPPRRASVPRGGGW